MDAKIEYAFRKYALLDTFDSQPDSVQLDKTQFKCAFIYLTGFKPTKDDMQLAKLKSGSTVGCFQMAKTDFVNLMSAYLAQLQTATTQEKTMGANQQQNAQQKPSKRFSEVEEAWAKLGGAKKGYITLESFHKLFDEYMPGMFDRDLALELFREVDSDKDDRLSFKDFADCLKFQLS